MVFDEFRRLDIAVSHFHHLFVHFVVVNFEFLNIGLSVPILASISHGLSCEELPLQG
jgi:hypothetical protein